MTLSALALWIGLGIAAVIAAVMIRRGVLHAIGAWRTGRAGPARLRASHHRIWRDPGAVEALSLVHGPGGAGHAPVAPFTFLEEPASGSQPCLSVRDARGRRWRIKWGHEARVETFAVRLAWACGYFAEITHFVPSGVIDGVPALGRARNCVEGEDGRFIDARFEADDPEVAKFFEEHSWSWVDNPFVGTRELSGLKIVMMLLSNWDSKDRRDVALGSNTAIFVARVHGGRAATARHTTCSPTGAARWEVGLERGHARAMGCRRVRGADAAVRHRRQGRARVFGYVGQRTADIAGDIPVEHARWFYGYASRISEKQLVEGLLASGATDDEAGRFARAIVKRIAQLGRVLVSCE